MTVSLKHQFVSNVTDSGDTTLVQPSNWNAEHLLTANADSLLGAITAGNVVEINCTSAGRALLDDADASAQRTTLGLGTVATQNANAVAITGGTIVANASGISIRDSDASNVMTIAVGSNLTANTTLTLTTGATTNRTLDISATNVTVSVAGAALIDDADAAAQRTTLGLGTISTQNSNNVTITGGSITGITDLAVADGGTGASDAATARTNLGIGTIATQNANNVSITGGSITGITDLAVADGGTGASDAATARTNLGIGTMGTQNANAVAITGGTIVANASGISIRDADASNVMTIAVGSNLTANTTLTLTTGATTNRTLDISASNVTISTAGAALIDDADAAAQRTTLGLGTISTQNSNNVSITGGSITGITDLAVADGGTGASDAATARTNLGLGTISTQNSNNVSITGGSITGITDLAVADGGTGASDAATARTNLGIGTIATQNANNVSITGGSITGITDLAVADGGTGASDAATARTNLGIGTLGTQNANAVAITGGTIVANASGISIRDADASNVMTIAVGSNLTANTTLTLTTGAATNRTLDISAANVTISTAGAALIDDADAATQRTTLGLGTGDSPEFTAVNIGNATDTTITRVSAGLVAVEGKTVVTETGAQTVQFAAGTNTAPSITTTGNTNTGIFFPAANTIAFTEGGTEVMRIDSSGRVGIGTNAPLYNLDVQSSGEPIIRAKTTGTGSAWFVGEAGASGSVLWHNASNTASVFTTNGTERFRIGQAGQWGIGGANYGTSGQVLTSGGSGAAPTWGSPTVSGALIRAPQILTSGTSYTTPAGCNSIYVECVGGGGGGGGSDNSATTQMTRGAGGGAGAYCASYLAVSPSTAYTYAIGAGGTAGGNTGGGGGSGGATTFTVGATTLSAGGGGGGGGASSGSNSEINGGTGGTATGGQINATGNDGQSGGGTSPNNTGVVSGGTGGGSFFGGAGRGLGFGSGAEAGEKGGGGGGSATTGNTTGVAGAAGGAGIIRIWEYT